MIPDPLPFVWAAVVKRTSKYTVGFAATFRVALDSLCVSPSTSRLLNQTSETAARDETSARATISLQSDASDGRASIDLL